MPRSGRWPLWPCRVRWLKTAWTPGAPTSASRTSKAWVQLRAIPIFATDVPIPGTVTRRAESVAVGLSLHLHRRPCCPCRSQRGRRRRGHRRSTSRSQRETRQTNVWMPLRTVISTSPAPKQTRVKTTSATDVPSPGTAIFRADSAVGAPLHQHHHRRSQMPLRHNRRS